jgi:hypothetical protein
MMKGPDSGVKLEELINANISQLTMQKIRLKKTTSSQSKSAGRKAPARIDH